MGAGKLLHFPVTTPKIVQNEKFPVPDAENVDNPPHGAGSAAASRDASSHKHVVKYEEIHVG
jgi:hypothetical protein